jgi:two-component system NtrC family response regulator
VKKILIVEDEKRMCRVLQLILETGGYRVATACDGREAMSVWDSFHPDVVFTDLKMPRADGMEVLRFGNRKYSGTPVIILTAFGTIPTAVAAIKLGAFDYITKPVDNDIVLEKARAALDQTTSAPGRRSSAKPRLIGSSAAMEKVRRDLELVSRPHTAVLITGESGTGKELAARRVHELSSSDDAPFIRVNCAAIPRDLLESCLFGHKRGAFTGATHDRPGAFVQARGGILFLDEIGDLPIELQPKLLHAVEDKIITPVGADTRIAVAVKIVSATNQDLAQMVRSGLFRSDLLYRLNTHTIVMPPLRSRPEDILELTQHFVTALSLEFNLEKPCVTPEAMSLLAAYSWPGNVRELKNILERLVLGCKEREIGPRPVADLLSEDPDGEGGVSGESRAKNLFEQEREIIVKALDACDWNQSKTARYLGITRNTLRYRQKKYNITP